MEVKIFCQCGSKYKFDVDPVNERMPWPVNCPACGADGTPAANEIIAQTLAANPHAATPAPAPVPMPMPMPMAAAAPAPAPSGLRINKPAPAPPAPAPLGAAPPPGGPPRFTPASPRPLASARPPAEGKSWLKIISGSLGTIFVLFIIGLKCWRIFRVGSIAYHAATAPVDTQLLANLKEMNLIADDNVVLYVKHDDHRQVAQECIGFWKEKDHRNFQITNADGANEEDEHFLVYPAHNGYVCIMGDLRWKDPKFEATAQHLSEKYNTLVFDERDVDKTGAFLFGVYEQGSNAFHVRITETRGGDIKTRTEHIEWAAAHGYKPGVHGSDDFNALDANNLTRNCGMKLWDQNDDASTNFLVIVASKK